MLPAEVGDPVTTLEQQAEFYGRWRSGNHFADAKPDMYVEYRTGRYLHRYELWDGPPVHAIVGGAMRVGAEPGQTFPTEGRRLFWQNFWTPDDGPDGIYTELPNVLNWDVPKSSQNNGIGVLTIAVENIAYPEETGPGGVYHSIRRGYYAPKRGFRPAGQPPLYDNGEQVVANDWFDRFNSGGQIRVWFGYGDLFVPLGPFLIDDVDTTSKPDRITITARDHGQTLTDMRVFGWNKEPRIKVPVIFRDRLEADNTKKVGYDVSASSAHSDHPVSEVQDTDSDTFWLSDGHNGPNFTEWVQLKVPEGRYEDFYFYPRQRGYEIFVSIYAKDRVGKPPTRNNAEIPEGWVDLGNGDVPGDNGGVPYVHHRKGLDSKPYRGVGLQDVYRLGKGSIIRVSIRQLARRQDNDYYAAVNRFFAWKRTVEPEVIRKHHILVDDVADMVRVVLRWAGFKEWDVETAGVRLHGRQVFGGETFYIDIIKKAMELTGSTFFMRNGTPDQENSVGVPCFRRPVVVDLGDDRVPVRALVRDTDLLEDIQTKRTDEPLAYIIRVRGKKEKSSEGGEKIDGDREPRLMYVYRPPWWRKLGGVVKHWVTTNNSFATKDQVKFAAWFVALQQALESDKATCGIPIYPEYECEGKRFGLELDSHLAVYDVGTGLVTRLWISELQMRYRRAEQPENVLSVGGALADSRDVRQICALINDTPRGDE